MNLKDHIRRHIKSFLGISNLEYQVGKLGANDLRLELERRARASSAEFIERNMQRATALTSGLEVLDYALKRVSGEGLFCEFGVYKGATINHAARQISSTIFGFDSFQGLPEHWRDGYPEGAFDISSDQLPQVEENVELVIGWFDSTLPLFLASHAGPISFLHVDCDLYSSTKTIFDLLGARIVPGSILVFDEYFNYSGWQDHEHKAFMEFIEASGQKFEYIGYNRYHEQVAVQIL